MKVALVAMILFVMVVNGERVCHGDEDCDDDECCHYRSFSLNRGGICKNLIKEGEECNDEDDFKVLGKYHQDCPCQNGLACVPSDDEDMDIIGNIYRITRCAKNETEEPKVVTTEVTKSPFIFTMPVPE